MYQNIMVINIGPEVKSILPQLSNLSVGHVRLISFTACPIDVQIVLIFKLINTIKLFNVIKWLKHIQIRVWV
uniref:Uncharacterized protein n=1 Tax=Kalanchoe fedtschenkoi TaxID=63787 RepID=A0A7N0T8Q0_KALFE